METIGIDHVRLANRRAGQYFFEQGATRFFRSRYPEYAYQAGERAYFVTSEQFDNYSPRLFTLRVCDLATGEVDTVGGFQQYRTRYLAEKALKELAKTK